jgi:hypothetical protein
MPSTVMRDSSKDYRTYWIRNGLYYGVDRGLGDAGAALPQDKLSKIPADDRQILVEETDADPAFRALVIRLMATDPQWDHNIAASAKAAAENEINPSKGRKGGWPRLRARVRDLVQSVATQAAEAASKLTPQERFQTVKAMSTGKIKVKPPAMSGLGDLGQWDIIGSLVGNLVGVGAGIYGATVTADAQKDIAKLQATSAMQNAQAQIAISNANAAIAAAQANILDPIGSTISTLATSTVAGVPVIIPIGAAIAIGLWLAFGRKSR